MGKLDIHVHLATQPCPVCFCAQERINFDRMMGIDRGILLSEPAAAGGCLETDEAALQWAQAAMGPMDAYAVSLRYPERFAWMCDVYLDGTDAPYEHLKRYKELGACGVGEFTQSLRLDDPQIRLVSGTGAAVPVPHARRRWRLRRSGPARTALAGGRAEKVPWSEVHRTLPALLG